VNELLRELNLAVEGEMVYDGDHIEIRPKISDG
jgi:hypothetical protein